MGDECAGKLHVLGKLYDQCLDQLIIITNRALYL